MVESEGDRGMGRQGGDGGGREAGGLMEEGERQGD